MKRTALLPVILLIALAACPAGGTLVLSGVSFAPDAPLVPGAQQHVVASSTLLPSGATTFVRGHELQMQTGLSDAAWSIQVTLDGRNAAQQNAAGSAAFVNGEILSYSTNHDVGLIVTIDGKVPQDATSPFMVLQVEEIDNSGAIVPGSTLIVTQQVTGQSPPDQSAKVPTLTPPVMTPATPRKAPGLTGWSALGALGAAGALLFRRKV